MAEAITGGEGDDRDGWYGAAEARVLAHDWLRLQERLAEAERERDDEEAWRGGADPAQPDVAALIAEMREAAHDSLDAGLLRKGSDALERLEGERARLADLLWRVVNDCEGLADTARQALIPEDRPDQP